MFYSHTFLARKSPLGTIWIAAHLENKLKRPQIESINIPSFAEKIMMPDVPIALRLSGHLLLGLVRIFSLKVNHLFSDCNRLVTDIRKAFASVPVDLPIEADHAPFESVTLPETFDLNALELDESYYKTDGPDKHLKPYDQITMKDQTPMEEEQYVGILVSEENELNLSPQSNGLNQSLHPTNVLSSFFHQENINPVSSGNVQIENEETFRRIPDGQTRDIKIMRCDPGDIPDGRTPDIEIMRCDPGDTRQFFDASSDIQAGQESSRTFNERQCPSPIPEGIAIPKMGSSPHAEQLADTLANRLNFSVIEASGIRSPVINCKPACRIKQGNAHKRKRNQTFDRRVVLSNKEMKKLLDDSANLVCKRRKLPCSDLNIWKFQRFSTKEDFFNLPLFSSNNITLETFKGAVPDKEKGTMKLDAQHATPTIAASSDIERARDGSNIENLILQVDQNASSSVSESHGVENSCTPLMPATENLSPVEPINMPDEEKGTSKMDAQPATPRSCASDIERARDPDDIEGLNSQFYQNASSSGSESHGEKNSDTILMPATGIPPPVEPINMNLETPLSKEHLDKTEVTDLPDKDLNFLNADGASPGFHGAVQVDNLSARTRAVAKYFKGNTLQAELDESGHISLNRILEQKNRRQSSRMFFETLVLKSFEFINVEQEEPYGDILITPTPALLSTKF